MAMTTSLQRPKLWFLGALLALFLLGDAARPTASASGAKTVSIVNFAFKPGTLTVKRGTSVGFSNTTAGTTHTASSGSFDTKRIAPGTTKMITFNKKGTFLYHCKIHTFMKGKIVVE